MKLILGLALAIAAIVINAAPAEDSALLISKANNKFGANFYSLLAKNKGNIFFSPLSIHAVLSIAYQGSKGKAYDALTKALQVPSAEVAANGYKHVMEGLNSVKNVTVGIANKAYISKSYSLQSDFKDIVEKKFYSEVENIDFNKSNEAAQKINSWVERKTRNKIQHFISADTLSYDTVLILINAIYFKGNWKLSFDKENTLPRDFHITENEMIKVDTMHIYDQFMYKYDTELKAKIVELAYNDDSVSMVIVLPEEINGIKNLENKLINYDLSKIIDGASPEDLRLALPKFKQESIIDVGKYLKKMDLSSIFETGAFSEMTNDKRVFVDRILQRAVIEVNEEGAEAAAATYFQMVNISFVPSYRKPEELKFDHPFLFLIRSTKSGAILFQGRINNPSVETAGAWDKTI